MNWQQGRNLVTDMARLIAKQSYEQNPRQPYCYSPEQIAELEQTTGQPFPEDFRWYLAHVGWRTIGFRRGTIRVELDDRWYILNFESAEHFAIAAWRYKRICNAPQIAPLPGEPRDYFPFTCLEGTYDPPVDLALFIKLTEPNRGAIWALRTYRDGQAPSAFCLAEDFPSFLRQLRPYAEMDFAGVIEGIPFEKDPWSPYLYTPKDLSELEALTGHTFPDDFRWYLAHIGWRKIDACCDTFVLQRGGWMDAVCFDRVEHLTSTTFYYREFAAKRDGERLPGLPRNYFPFYNSRQRIYLYLVIKLDEPDRGSIWAVRAIGYFDNPEPDPPIRLADDFRSFLAQIGPSREWNKLVLANNNALFNALLIDYLADSTSIKPTTTTDAAALISIFFEQPENIIFDGARNVEYQYHRNGRNQETAAAFSKSAEQYAREAGHNPYLLPPPLLRSQIIIHEPEVFDGNFSLNQMEHGYHIVKVESVVSDKLKLTETYLLHRSEAGWSMVRRHDAAIGDVRIRGVGTFTFDTAHDWRLKKKITPAWGELPAELSMDGHEGALTKTRIAFIKEVIGKADFKPVFEAYVFDLYLTQMYPEFLAMSEEDQQEWADCYPVIEKPGDIWTLLGEDFSIYLKDEQTFHIATDACWDPEHGLTMDVREWRIVRG